MPTTRRKWIRQQISHEQMPMNDANPPFLVLVRDLMFQSRITGTAKQAGAAFIVLRDPANLGDRPGRLLIVDLNQPGAIEAAGAWKQATSRPVVGFVSHVDSDAIQRARAAGIDHVLARSAFVRQLPKMF